MKRVLVAGATGYLGGFLVQELKNRGYWVRVLVRKASQADRLSKIADEVFIGEVTQPETLKNVAEGMDWVFSSIGITRQKDNLTYEAVDYQGNMNLLQEALNSGVKRFLYVSVFCAEQMTHLKIIAAKERFAQALCHSGINYSIIYPTGFFADMKEFLQMAKNGRVMLFGDGKTKGNPIAGTDLAKVCCDSAEQGKKKVNVGGPKVYTYHEIAQAAFNALGKPAKIGYIPNWVIPPVIQLLRWFSSSTFYGPFEFFLTALTRSMVAEQYGELSLEDFFQQEAMRE